MQNVQPPLPSPQTPWFSPVFVPFAPALSVVGYARVSTDLQREKETIKTQVELIERHCVEKGYRLLEVISDNGVSGTRSLEQRPGGRRLLELCRGGKVVGLIVYKSDRIGRDVFVNEMAVRQLHDELGIDFQGVAEKIEMLIILGARTLLLWKRGKGHFARIVTKAARTLIFTGMDNTHAATTKQPGRRIAFKNNRFWSA